MRNKKSQVIVYDMVHRQWRGCDWVPPEDEDRVALLLRTINELKRDVAYLKTSVKKQERLLGQLERKRPASKRREVEEEGEPEPEEDVDPDVIEIQKRATEAREAMKMARATIESDEWFKAMRTPSTRIRRLPALLPLQISPSEREGVALLPLDSSG